VRSVASLGPLLALGGLLLALGACAGGDGASSAPDGESDDEIARRVHHFVDVSADAPMKGVAREKILAALTKIDRVAHQTKSPLRRALATETLARIESGDVLLGSIEAARGIDRWHMCKDEKLHACDGPPPAGDDRTWHGDAELARTLESDLAGYQWGNRIYFTLSSATNVDELAATLVHETDHVSNRSECSYYREIDAHVVDPDRAYVEEYRAFLSECYFTEESASVAKCNAFAAGRVDEYGFASDLARVLPSRSRDPKVLAELILAAEPEGAARFGRLVPRKKDWPGGFGACGR
jgi:hypothetical protein